MKTSRCPLCPSVVFSRLTFPRLVAAVLPEVEQLAEAVEAASALEEVVAHKLGRTGTALNVDTETDGKESFEFLGQLVGLLEAGCAVCGDKVEGFQGLFVKVWRLGLNHFDGHDTQGPDVDLVAVLFLLNDFGCHPVGCADHSCALGSLFGELGTETEIGC
jgi:hypothetical protein